MKAGCAATIEAFTALAERGGPFPPICLALVVGEEEEGDGAKALVRKLNFPWALIAEPTNMVACLGHYGYLDVSLVTRGKRAHSSMPELGQNAIENMLKLLLEITKYAAATKHGVVYNIRDLSGFPGGFVVPDACQAYIDVHLPPEASVDTLKAELEQVVESAAERIASLDAHIRFEESYSGYRISEERGFIKKLRTVYESRGFSWAPQDFRSHSDGNLLWAGGVDPIILGPGRLELAHTPEESVSFQQVVQAADLYLNLALAL